MYQALLLALGIEQWQSRCPITPFPQNNLTRDLCFSPKIIYALSVLNRLAVLNPIPYLSFLPYFKWVPLLRSASLCTKVGRVCPALPQTLPAHPYALFTRKVHQYPSNSVQRAMVLTNRLNSSQSLQILSEACSGSAPAGLLEPTQLPEHWERIGAGKFSFQEIFLENESLSDHNNLTWKLAARLQKRLEKSWQMKIRIWKHCFFKRHHPYIFCWFLRKLIWWLIEAHEIVFINLLSFIFKGLRENRPQQRPKPWFYKYVHISDPLHFLSKLSTGGGSWVKMLSLSTIQILKKQM